MPLERFYRLSEDKKKAIRNAAMKEFARVPIDKVSINKIIQDADISRGSFYTYFEDKWDVLAYIFEDWQEGMRHFFAWELKRHKGDIWKVLEKFLVAMIDFCSKGEVSAFIKNVILHSNSEEMLNGFSCRMEATEEHRKMEQWIFESVDKSNFRSQTQEDFHRFLTLAMPAMGTGIKDYYQGSSKESVREEFVKKLEMLRNGVCSG